MNTPMPSPSNDLIIYHGNCADGFMAATILRKFLRDQGRDPEMVAGVYQQPPPDCEQKDVIVVDFSYKRPVMAEILVAANTVVILDHHKTAIEDLEGLEGFYDKVFDLEKSGAMLAWEYCYPDTMPPDIVTFIQDRDLWQFKYKVTRPVQAALFSYPYEFLLWESFIAPGYDWTPLYVGGEAIERKHFKDIRELLKVCRKRMMICGHEVLAANLPYTLSSDAGHIMVEEEKEPFGCCYYDVPDGRVFSLRSIDTAVDVSEIAKSYGGGGHRNAAGFKVSKLVAEAFEDAVPYTEQS